MGLKFEDISVEEREATKEEEQNLGVLRFITVSRGWRTGEVRKCGAVWYYRPTLPFSLEFTRCQSRIEGLGLALDHVLGD